MPYDAAVPLGSTHTYRFEPVLRLRGDETYVTTQSAQTTTYRASAHVTAVYSTIPQLIGRARAPGSRESRP